MSYQIVCLANSKKFDARCFAGRLVRGRDVGPWIRPVGDRDGGAVEPSEMTVQDGGLPSLLDIVTVPLREARPHLHQKEDWSFDAGIPWERGPKFPRKIKDLDRLLSPAEHLWSRASSSTRGLADRVAEKELPQVPDSLRFIKPDILELQVVPGIDRPRSRAHFMYLGVEYNLAITDPNYGVRMLGSAAQTTPMRKCYLTISLGEILNGYSYKLVAGIVEVW